MNKYISESIDEIYLPIQVSENFKVTCSIRQFYEWNNIIDSTLTCEYPDALNILIKQNGDWRLMNIKSGIKMVILTDTIVPIVDEFIENIVSTYPRFIIRNKGQCSIVSNLGDIIFSDSIFSFEKNYSDKIKIELMLKSIIKDYVVLCRGCRIDYVTERTENKTNYIQNRIDTISIGYSSGLKLGGGLYNVYDLKNKNLLFKTWSRYLKINYYTIDGFEASEITELTEEFKWFDIIDNSDFKSVKFTSH